MSASAMGWLLALAMAAGCGDDGLDDGSVTSDAQGAAAADATVADAMADATADAQLSCGCAAFAAPAAAGQVMGAGIELSGIAASRLHRSVLYVHNDDAINGQLTVYAINESAAIRATYTLTGGETDNLEDIAVGPCPAAISPGPCVFVGNIGDNSGTAVERQVHLFPERALTSGAVPFTTMRYAYPGGAHPDAESLVVDRAGEVYVLTKTAARTEIFRIPIGSGRVTAVRIGELPLLAGQTATGADLSPCGTRLLVRSYARVHEWRAATASWPALIAATRTDLPVLSEPQGEAVAWLEGGGYATISEGANPPLNIARCR